jgi:hypothetical protein
LAVGTLALFFHPSVTIAGRSFLLFDVGGVVAAAGLAMIFGLSAARNTRTLYKAEPLR